MMYGGGISPFQPGPPGFYQNPHSINYFNITETHWYKDLGLESKVKYVTPRYGFAQPHADGTALNLMDILQISRCGLGPKEKNGKLFIRIESDEKLPNDFRLN